MIRKNTITNASKKDTSPGCIRNTSKPAQHSSPLKPARYQSPPQPILLPNQIPKLQTLQQSFGRMNATLNSLFDKNIAEKFKNQQSVMIAQCLNGFEARANEIETKLDKPVLILKGIENQVLAIEKKKNGNGDGCKINPEHEKRFRDLEDKLRKLENIMK